VLLDYRRKRIRESFGPVTLELECLEDLDRTIDEVFAWLEKTGNPQLLEELCPYFGVVWPAARALGNLVATSDEIAGRRVIEIGCGLALPGMIAARRGARVTATDYHPEVPRFLERNLELNRITDFAFERIDWQKPAETARLGRFDWVIGSDILYERSHPAAVASAIEALSAPGGRIVIADPARPYLQSFVDEMSTRGLAHQSRVENEIWLLEFRRQP
jgi:predicted nicotinamide N-methyase